MATAVPQQNGFCSPTATLPSCSITNPIRIGGMPGLGGDLGELCVGEVFAACLTLRRSEPGVRLSPRTNKLISRKARQVRQENLACRRSCYDS